MSLSYGDFLQLAGMAGLGPGTPGLGIAATTITYQTAASATVVPAGTWTSALPVVAKGQYLWTRIVQKLTDNSTVTAYTVGYIGQDAQVQNGFMYDQDYSKTSIVSTGGLTQNLRQKTIPGGSIGAVNGRLLVSGNLSFDSVNSNNRVTTVKLGSVVVMQIMTNGGSLSCRFEFGIRNRAANSQIIDAPLASGGYGTTAQAIANAAIDTTVDQVLSVDTTFANTTTATTVNLEYLETEIRNMPAAS